MQYPKLDRAAVISHLAALGYRNSDAVFLRAIKNDRAEKIRANLPNLPWNRLESLSKSGYGLYVVVNGDGHTDGDVKQGRALFYEHDDLDKANQIELWRHLGMPAPTLQVDTGGKSIHSYWRIEDCPIELWRETQTDLLDFANADRSIKNPSRVMRLAGTAHQKTGQLASIVHWSEAVYAVETLRQAIPAQQPAPLTLPADISSRPDAIPLENCLTKDDRALIESGLGEGGRNVAGAKLARNLVATAKHLDWIGQPYSGTPRQLFDWYCARCSPAIDSREAENIWKSAEKSNPTPSLTPDAITNCINAWRLKAAEALKAVIKQVKKIGKGDAEEATPEGRKRKHDRIMAELARIEALKDASLQQLELTLLSKSEGISRKDLAEMQERKKQAENPEATNEIAIAFRKVEKLLGKRLRLNTLTQQIELDGNPFAIRRMRLKLANDFDIALRREDAEEFVRELAERDAYSPVAQQLEAVYAQHGNDTGILDGITAADGTVTLENFATRYFGRSEPIYNVFLKKTLIAAVARALDPGCQVDTALVLQGKQGWRKTSFFRTLASPEWFDDSLGNASDKDERLKLHRTWFVEWGEIESAFKRRDVGQIKQFITSVADNLRPPYGREVERMPRHSIICGTTNLEEFLSDPTGNRRFWVIRLAKSIDIEQLELERDRIWAAAVALYKAGEPWKLSPEEDAIAASIASEFRTIDPWQELILAGVTGLSETTTRHIFDTILQIEPGRQDRAMEMRIAEIMRSAGWVQTFKGDARRRTWLAPLPPDQPSDRPVEGEVDHPFSPPVATVSRNSDRPDQPFPLKTATENFQSAATPPPEKTFLPPLLNQKGRSGRSEEVTKIEAKGFERRSTSDETGRSNSAIGRSEGRSGKEMDKWRSVL